MLVALISVVSAYPSFAAGGKAGVPITGSTISRYRPSLIIDFENLTPKEREKICAILSSILSAEDKAKIDSRSKQVLRKYCPDMKLSWDNLDKEDKIMDREFWDGFHDEMDRAFGRGRYVDRKSYANERGESGQPRWMERFSPVDQFGAPTVFSADFMKDDK